MIGKVIFLAQAKNHRRFNDAWEDGVDADTFGTVVHGGGLGETQDAMFRRDIVGSGGDSYSPERGGSVYDRSSTGFEHCAHLVLHAVEDAGQVDLDDSVPSFGGDFMQGQVALFNARIIESAMQDAESTYYFIDGRLHGRLVRNVTRD
ncbi:hypothetical protein D3C72_966820 [compost metagenome]